MIRDHKVLSASVVFLFGLGASTGACVGPSDANSEVSSGATASREACVAASNAWRADMRTTLDELDAVAVNVPADEVEVGYSEAIGEWRAVLENDARFAAQYDFCGDVTAAAPSVPSPPQTVATLGETSGRLSLLSPPPPNGVGSMFRYRYVGLEVQATLGGLVKSAVKRMFSKQPARPDLDAYTNATTQLDELMAGIKPLREATSALPSPDLARAWARTHAGVEIVVVPTPAPTGGFFGQQPFFGGTAAPEPFFTPDPVRQQREITALEKQLRTLEAKFAKLADYNDRLEKAASKVDISLAAALGLYVDATRRQGFIGSKQTVGLTVSNNPLSKMSASVSLQGGVVASFWPSNRDIASTLTRPTWFDFGISGRAGLVQGKAALTLGAQFGDDPLLLAGATASVGLATPAPGASLDVSVGRMVAVDSITSLTQTYLPNGCHLVNYTNPDAPESSYEPAYIDCAGADATRSMMSLLGPAAVKAGIQALTVNFLCSLEAQPLDMTNYVGGLAPTPSFRAASKSAMTRCLERSGIN